MPPGLSGDSGQEVVAAVPVVEDPGAGAPPVAAAPGLYANVRAQAWRLGGSSSSVLRQRALRQRVGVPVVTRRS